MSLKKISEMSGVSIATVSRILNDPEYRGNNAETTEKVRRLAREMKYQPNDFAKNLRKSGEQKQPVVDILITRHSTEKEDPFFEELFKAVEVEIHRQNCVVGDVLNAAVFRENIKKKNTGRVKNDAVIVLGKCPEDIVTPLTREYGSAVAVDRNPMEYRMDEVTCSGAAAAKMAVEYLIELGHKKIGYIGDCSMEARYAGFYETLSNHRISLNYNYVISTSQTRAEGREAFARMNGMSEPPTAILCANDVTALGVIEAMKMANGRKRTGVYTPSIIAIDDIAEASEVKPMLTTIRIPKRDMAHLAVMLLRDRLDKGHEEVVRIELPCHLMARESTTYHI